MGTFEQVMLWASASMLTGALILAISRMLIGPKSLDRVVSLDTIVAVAQCSIAVYIGFSLDSTTAPVIAALALISFLGSVSVARFRVADSAEIPIIHYASDADSSGGSDTRAAEREERGESR